MAFPKPLAWLGVLVCLLAGGVSAAGADPGPDSLPGQVDEADLAGLQGTEQTAGRIVPLLIPGDHSWFAHQTEYVYLPPAWFRTKPAPQLPVVMMLGGDRDPSDYWLTKGNAAEIADDFAARHGGNAPILVFADTAGADRVETGCVNGTAGDVEDHLFQEVRPFVIQHFRASSAPTNWGLVGWSMGGTCAVDFAVMHPELFSGFVDIAGDFFPNLGNRDDTIANLYGGSATVFDLHDPVQVMARHGSYAHTVGWFEVSGDPDADRDAATEDPDLSPVDQIHLQAARQLCGAGRQVGIACGVVPRQGRHTWSFASAAFAESLPWLAGYLQTPGAAPAPLAGALPAPTHDKQPAPKPAKPKPAKPARTPR